MTTAVWALLVLALCIVLFITEWIPSAFTALLGAVLMYFVGAIDYSSTFAGFANNIVILVVGSMIVGTAMYETGTARLIAKQCIRLSRGNEKLFILLASLVSGILSAFIANTAVVACFLPIIDSVARTSNMSRKNMTMSITFGAMYGGSMTLVGSTPQLTANGIIEPILGYGVTMYQYLGPGLVIFIVYLIYTQLFGYKAGIKIWGDRADDGDIASAEEAAKLDHPVDKKKVILMLCIFLGMIASYSLQKIPTAMTAALAGLLCIVLRLCTEKQAYAGIAWGPVFMLAGTLAIGTGLSQSGAGEIMADAILAVVGDHVTATFMFAIFVIMSIVISNFAANSTTVLILLPIAVNYCTSMGWNPITFTVGIVIAANLACATPVAHQQVTMTMVAGYKFSDYFRYNWIMQILTVILTVIVTPVFLPF